MREKRVHEVKGTRRSPKKPFVEIPTIGKLFQPRGVYDGKMFHSAGKVTYTFVDQKEVISLHFDRQRKAIFYKGHNILNIKLTSNQTQHLERFGVELHRDMGTRNFTNAFQKVLSAVTAQKK